MPVYIHYLECVVCVSVVFKPGSHIVVVREVSFFYQEGGFWKFFKFCKFLVIPLLYE